MTEEKTDYNIKFLQEEIEKINKTIKEYQHAIKTLLIIKNAITIGLKQLQKNKK